MRKFKIEIEIGFGTRSDSSQRAGRDLISPKAAAAVTVVFFLASLFLAKGLGAI